MPALLMRLAMADPDQGVFIERFDGARRERRSGVIIGLHPSPLRQFRR